MLYSLQQAGARLTLKDQKKCVGLIAGIWMEVTMWELPKEPTGITFSSSRSKIVSHLQSSR